MSSMSSVLSDIRCPKCNFTFRVIDHANFVCNRCYYHELPKYVTKTRRKGTNNGFDRFESKDPGLIELIIEEARDRGNGKTPGEKKYIEFICESLRERGMMYTKELTCENGRIDIFIDGTSIPKRPPKIIEAKILDDGSHLTSALGQLLFYSMSYPHADLYVATPMHLSQKIRRIFGLYNIEEWAENKTDVWKEDSRAI